MSQGSSGGGPPAGFKIVKPVEYQIRMEYQRGATGLKIMTIDEDIKIYIGRLYDRTEVQYDNMIKFDNQIVSRNHCHLAIRGAARTLCIKDAGSSHGTFLNKIRLSNSGEESEWIELASSDKVSLGSDLVVDGEMNKCVQLEFEISRFEGKESKVYIENGDEEEGPPSPVITSKQFALNAKKKPSASGQSTQATANGSGAGAISQIFISGSFIQSSDQMATRNSNSPVSGSMRESTTAKTPTKRMSLLSPFGQIFGSRNVDSTSDKRGSLSVANSSQDGARLSSTSLQKSNTSINEFNGILGAPRGMHSNNQIPSPGGSTHGSAIIHVTVPEEGKAI